MRRAACVLALVLSAWPALAPAQQLRAVPIAAGLAKPTFVTGAPGDPSRLFFLEQHTGRVRIIDTATRSVLPTPFLTVPTVSTGAEQGLLGLAFHPDYAQNGLFFTNRTDAAGNTQIERYQVSPTNPNVALATPTSLLSVAQPQANHNGGWLGFGPDGYLYASLGDGGGGNDTGTGHTTGTGNAQDITNNLLGKILRFDVDSPPPSGQNYSVPASNPFVGREGDDLIWAYGLRNPWRASFDRGTGDFWIGDVGQSTVEEIDFQPATSAGGENYGWRLREGTIATPATGIGGAKPDGAVDPIFEYLHQGQGKSVVGGYVYRGPYEELQGKYFFGDTIGGNVWTITFDGSAVEDFDGANFTSFMDVSRMLAPIGGFQTLSSFGEDALGNLYIVELGSPFDPTPSGRIWMITPEPGTALLLTAGLAALRLCARPQLTMPRSRSEARRAAS
jgi:glucose/arabinose dehydrogenase